MPNRRQGLEAWLASISAGGGMDRVAALDRWKNHTLICPDSFSAHRNMKRLAWAATVRRCKLNR